MSSSSLSISDIILQYICPCAGMIIANIMFSAPYKDLRRAIIMQGNNGLGDLNPTPWAMMLGNCFGWTLYGLLRINFWVFFANAPGFVLSIWLNLGAIKLLYSYHHSQQLRSSIVEYLIQQEIQNGRHDIVEDDDEKRKKKKADIENIIEENVDEVIVKEIKRDVEEALITNNNIDHPETKTIIDEEQFTTPVLSTDTSSTDAGGETSANNNDDDNHILTNPVETISNLVETATNAVTNATQTTKDYAKIIWDVTSQSTPAPAPHERLVLIVVVIWMSIASLIGFAGRTNLFTTTTNMMTNNDSSSAWGTHETNTSIVGYAVNLNLVFFYGAPLSTIWTVLRQRNTASIHIPTMITNTLNGTFWFIYGLAILDAFIYVPNGLGAMLGIIQIVLLIFFPRKRRAGEVI